MAAGRFRKAGRIGFSRGGCVDNRQPRRQSRMTAESAKRTLRCTPQDSTATEPLTSTSTCPCSRHHHEKAPRHPKRTLAAVVGRLRGDFDDDRPSHGYAPRPKRSGRSTRGRRPGRAGREPQGHQGKPARLRSTPGRLCSTTSDCIAGHGRQASGRVCTVVDVDKLDPASESSRYASGGEDAAGLCGWRSSQSVRPGRQVHRRALDPAPRRQRGRP